MVWRVAVDVGEARVSDASLGHADPLHLRIDTDSAERRISHDVWKKLDRFKLPSTPDAAVDLLRFAAVVYTLDLRLPRSRAADGWTRDIEVHLPVTELDKWEGAKEVAEKLLRFLTGDVWGLELYEGCPGRPPYNDRLRNTRRPLEASAVCLFSGGLDSFIGAADALGSGQEVYLVSHAQGKYTTTPQKEMARSLAAKFDPTRFRHLQCHVTAPSCPALRPCSVPIGSETTMRSRSLVFFALGVAVAASLRKGMPLMVPENGLISINPPLTTSRAGSHSTRTTHPYTVLLVNQLLEALNLDVELRLDYRFTTKGEMLKRVRNRSWVYSQATKTVSCGKSNWAAMEARRRGLADVTHCGSCVPCLIRRAALHAAGIGGEAYVNQLLNVNTSEDVRAFKIAAERGVSLSDVLETGPIPPEDVEAYLDVVERGFREVRAIF